MFANGSTVRILSVDENELSTSLIGTQALVLKGQPWSGGDGSYTYKVRLHTGETAWMREFRLEAVNVVLGNIPMNVPAQPQHSAVPTYSQPPPCYAKPDPMKKHEVLCSNCSTPIRTPMVSHSCKGCGSIYHPKEC